ncbi:hypothetical protein DPX16_10901 [Anabarilius grahami]|uniref:Uncharacterized protein n=1 Tax=Anabarilius grahami TaxID=495550 RepID=A0A3N0Z959_ANAGA|nr:hypothetical protein DPX16_10901 [Anabarilius grahami]
MGSRLRIAPESGLTPAQESTLNVSTLLLCPKSLTCLLIFESIAYSAWQLRALEARSDRNKARNSDTDESHQRSNPPSSTFSLRHFLGVISNVLAAVLQLFAIFGGSTLGSGQNTELGALSSDSTPNTHTTTHTIYYLIICKCELVKYVFSTLMDLEKGNVIAGYGGLTESSDFNQNI